MSKEGSDILVLGTLGEIENAVTELQRTGSDQQRHVLYGLKCVPCSRLSDKSSSAEMETEKSFP